MVKTNNNWHTQQLDESLGGWGLVEKGNPKGYMPCYSVYITYFNWKILEMQSRLVVPGSWGWREDGVWWERHVGVVTEGRPEKPSCWWSCLVSWLLAELKPYRTKYPHTNTYTYSHILTPCKAGEIWVRSVHCINIILVVIWHYSFTKCYHLEKLS